MTERGKIVNYRGIPIEQLTREELLEALQSIADYYEDRLENKDKLLNFLEVNK